MKLNIATERFSENEKRGLLLCGINWGGDPTAATDEPAEVLSFFSDASVNNYPYRNRLLRWFNSWGHPLETRRGCEGAFERSIAQTNWLPDQGISMRQRNTWQECIAHQDNLFFHLQELQPRVLMFCGTTLIRVLNDPACLPSAQDLLGTAGSLRIFTKEVTLNGKAARRFNIGIQKFDRCDVVAVPHPTGSMGLSDAYIAAFSEEIGGILSSFRSELQSATDKAAMT